LEFLAPALEQTRVVVVGTYRDEEVQRSQALSHTLTELRRAPRSLLLALGGLDRRETAELIALTAGQEPTDTLVAEIAQHTEGNPFFVREVTDLLVSTGRFDAVAMNAPLGIPAAVEGAIARRLERLSSECRGALATAAVIGREFGVEVLVRTTDLARERVLGLIEEAIAARIVGAGEIAGSYRFAHALIRETLYAQIPTIGRLRRHQQIGRVLETMYAAHLPASVSPERFPSRGEFPWPRAAEVLAQLAHHYAEAQSLDDAGKAITYGRLAAACAMAHVAYEDARVHCERTLQIVEQTVPLDERARYALLLTLSGAQLYTSEWGRARATAFQAIQAARRIGDADLLARAAIALPWQDGAVDESVFGMLEEARQALGPGDSALKARLLGRLGQTLRWSPAWERGAALRHEAVEMARRVGDKRARGETLGHYVTPYWPDALEAQFAAATELLQLGELTGAGLEARATLLLLTGDVSRACEYHGALHRLRFEPRRAVHWDAAMRALLEGRFDDAERLSKEALLTSPRAGSISAPAAYAMQEYQLRKERGQLRELAEASRAFASQYYGMPAWRYAVAAVYAELGAHSEARALLSQLASCGLADLPRDSGWLAGLSLLSETCAYLGDAEAAALVYDLLLPHAGLIVVVGQTVVCRGAVSEYLGLLAATMRRWSEAEGHFQHALELNAKLQARPAIARSQQEYGAMLLERGAPGDRGHALDLLRGAIETADELGMSALLDRAVALERNASPESTGSANPVAPAAASAASGQNDRHRPQELADTPTVLRREGDYWTLAHDGTTSRLKDVRGLQYLAHLVRYPGQEFHVLDLMREFGASERELGEGGDPAATSGAKLEMLDATAKAAYRQRLSELREELEETAQFNDLGRAERLRLEIDALTEQLATAVGLGGRDRDAASATERARSTVTQRIKAAVKRIGAHAPLLADHLSSRVKTGTYCAYQPDPVHPVLWLLD
jgi:tetratricopeptide (TPR) repeat protein